MKEEIVSRENLNKWKNKKLKYERGQRQWEIGTGKPLKLTDITCTALIHSNIILSFTFGILCH